MKDIPTNEWFQFGHIAAFLVAAALLSDPQQSLGLRRVIMGIMLTGILSLVLSCMARPRL